MSEKEINRRAERRLAVIRHSQEVSELQCRRDVRLPRHHPPAVSRQSVHNWMRRYA